MKFAFQVFLLLVMVLLLFSFAVTAQTIPDEKARSPISNAQHKLAPFGGVSTLQPAVFSLTASGKAHLPSAASCANMLSLDIQDTEIKTAQLIPADPDNELPEYCDVMGFTDKTIGFDVRMPTTWNGKMYFGGNRGYAGHIRYNISDGLSRNYATVSTDTGHQVTSDLDILDASWALNNRQAEINFGFRAVHLTTLVGKLIISAYYGGTPKYSYFDGCSTGGGQALHEAELFPEDYDGFIAGAPVFDFTGTLMALNWKMQAIQATPTSDIISLDNLSLVGNAVLDKCDAVDGLKDGLIADPRKCNFDPASLLCKKGESTNCLTAPQAHAFQLIYQGPRNSFGFQLFPGLMKGGETPDGFGQGDGWGWDDQYPRLTIDRIYPSG